MPPTHAVAVTSDGYSLRFGFDGFVEPSTRAGRRYARPSEGVEVVGVAKIDGSETMIAATAQARAMLCKIDEINYLSGPGQGRHPDQAERRTKTACSGSSRRSGDRDLLTVETSRGAEQTISTTKYEVTEPRRQGARTAAARPVHAHRAAGSCRRRRRWRSQGSPGGRRGRSVVDDGTADVAARLDDRERRRLVRVRKPRLVSPPDQQEVRQRHAVAPAGSIGVPFTRPLAVLELRAPHVQVAAEPWLFSAHVEHAGRAAAPSSVAPVIFRRSGSTRMTVVLGDRPRRGSHRRCRTDAAVEDRRPRRSCTSARLRLGDRDRSAGPRGLRTVDSRPIERLGRSSRRPPRARSPPCGTRRSRPASSAARRCRPPGRTRSCRRSA